MAVGVFLGMNFDLIRTLALPKETSEHTGGKEFTETVCPPLECSCSNEQADELSQPDAATFDEASVLSSPDKAVEFFNKLCSLVTKSSTSMREQKLGVPTTLFCYKHILTYKRGYGYSWDNAESTEMGYYSGVDLPPYQMDWFQYSAIHAVISSIPSKPVKDDLERLGKSFIDAPSNYNQWKALESSPRGSSGPRVLFWGCGADTPMHALLVKFLGGSITFIDNSASFIKECKKVSHEELVCSCA